MTLAGCGPTPRRLTSSGPWTAPPGKQGEERAQAGLINLLHPARGMRQQATRQGIGGDIGEAGEENAAISAGVLLA